MSISLLDANTIIQIAIQTARSQKAAPLAVVVLDPGGHLKAFQSEDRIGFLRGDIAFAKAWSALGMRQPSRQLASRAEKQPMFFTSLLAVSRGRMALSAGGVICIDTQGDIVGSVGISGDTADVDEICAVAGIEAAGFRALATSG
ncbi:GlcG/HbpS family heme-binding protein [Bradyrhizobium viridifuturi]|uniref:GlcG/HbpS family heme-binding protein n=1 Tax=Bradyrhizobium viridifuturi TaxID=1654716 RepID=UPI00067F60DE|nr:heme-binding protein [Bradyrhizobium viridifuturi]